MKKDYNDVETKGGRAALKIELNDNWTIPAADHGTGAGHQRQLRLQSEGRRSGNESIISRRRSHDSWVQSALTIQGKISNFDLVYSGAYLTRNTHESQGLHRLLAVL